MLEFVAVATLALFFVPPVCAQDPDVPPVPPLFWENRDIPVANRPDLFVRLTLVPHFYLGDPPMHVDRVTVTLRCFEKTSSKESTDDSKVLSSFGPFQSGELVLADAVEIHHKPWLLLATQNQGDLMFFQIDGDRLLLQPEHQGSSFSYRNDENGDLLALIQPVNRDEGLPHVVRIDGVSPSPSEKNERPLLQDLETAHQIKT